MSRKAKKQRRPTQREFPVLIGVPVPTMDHKVNSGLSVFMAGCTMRHIAEPYGQPSRDATPGRNKIIRDFLTNPQYQSMTHLLFMDADTCPINPYAIERMLGHQRDVVAGVTPILMTNTKLPTLWWNVVPEGGKGNMPINQLPKEPFKADKVGGTTILVHRRVLEKLEPPYQKPTYDENHIEFKQSEDYYFCDKIRAAGFNIWVDPTIMCHHWHTMDMMMIVQMIIRAAYGNKDN